MICFFNFCSGAKLLSPVIIIRTPRRLDQVPLKSIIYTTHVPPTTPITKQPDKSSARVMT